MKKIILFFACVMTLLTCAGHAQESAHFDFDAIKSLPIQHEGRLKPMDTVARNFLLLLSGKQSLSHNGKKLAPIEWLFDMMVRTEKSSHYNVFRIDHPDVLGLINKEVDEDKYFSFGNLKPYFTVIRSQASLAAAEVDENRTSFHHSILKLWQQITLYIQLNNTLMPSEAEDFSKEVDLFEKTLVAISQQAKKTPESSFAVPEEIRIAFDFFAARYNYLASAALFHVLPPLPFAGNDTWFSMGQSLLFRLQGMPMHPAAGDYLAIISAYEHGDAPAFNTVIHEYHDRLEQQDPSLMKMVHFEVLFNTVQPFYFGIIFYLLAFLFAVVAELLWPKKLRRLAFYLLFTAFLLHSGGLIARMIIEGRPPVTNLYSSAVFVGWAAALIGIFLERIYRNGLGITVSAVVGSLTLVVAHHLGSQGDTMEMMRAVLNSNFWLSTHVVTVTIGYSSTFLAGTLAVIFILRKLLRRAPDKKYERNIVSMVYGIIFFALLFSFVGTILGGIWADQSWGRFWGWDPKENGALLIVLWNAVILHCRWGGYIKTKGLMLLAVGGNIITSLSWFGVNMLGVGLHSYGFMDNSAFWLFSFIASQLLVIALGAWLLEGWWQRKSSHRRL